MEQVPECLSLRPEDGSAGLLEQDGRGATRVACEHAGLQVGDGAARRSGAAQGRGQSRLVLRGYTKQVLELSCQPGPNVVRAKIVRIHKTVGLQAPRIRSVRVPEVRVERVCAAAGNRWSEILVEQGSRRTRVGGVGGNDRATPIRGFRDDGLRSS